MRAHDCAHHGHVWLEAHGVLYSRGRHRKGQVHVHCQFCPETATVETHGAFTRGNAKEPIGDAIPPSFLKVMDRALIDHDPASVAAALKQPIPELQQFMERALEAAPDVAVPEPDDNNGPARDS